MSLGGLYTEIFNKLEELKTQYESEIGDDRFAEIVQTWAIGKTDPKLRTELESTKPVTPVKNPAEGIDK